MNTYVKDGKTWAKVSDLILWDKNPRGIKEDRFEELKNRLKRQGQFKPLIVTQNAIVVGGNMRLRAAIELGWTEVWVSMVTATTDKEIFDIALTDNEEMGYYDDVAVAELALAVGFTPIELKTYELNLAKPVRLDLINEYEPFEYNRPIIEEDDLLPEIDLGDKHELSDEFSQKVGTVVYEPKESDHKPSELFTIETKFDDDISQIQNSDLKKLFKLRTAFFAEFNFSKIADYYAYQATPEEQRVFEKLALVLLDKDQLIELGFSDLLDSVDTASYE